MISLIIAIVLIALSLSYSYFNFYKKFSTYSKDKKLMEKSEYSYIFKNNIIIGYLWYLFIIPLCLIITIVLLAFWIINFRSGNFAANAYELSLYIIIILQIIFEWLHNVLFSMLCVYIYNDTLITINWFVNIKNIHSILLNDKNIEIKTLDDGLENSYFLKNNKNLLQFLKQSLSADLFV